MTIAVAGGLVGALSNAPTFGLNGGLAVGLAAGFYLLTSAGRRYLMFLACCRGRLLPWRLGAFLNWSYGAGLLRVSGIAYQFRHRELQDWLAANPTA
ncbi:hypothetical protein OG900_20110 [Streptomyces sp. NBC_00433]